MRIIINFGAPLNVDSIRYNDITDRFTEQKEKVSNFQSKMLQAINEFKMENPDGLNVLIFSEAVSQIEFNKLVLRDTTFAVFSVTFVFIYFIVYLRSLFLGFISILLILMSFGFTALIHQGLFRVTYYSSLHNLVIFIVLGIGADDIFVFINAWSQSSSIQFFEGDR